MATAEDKIKNQREALQQQLRDRIEQGTVNSGELSAIVRELDFLKALEEVLQH